ncbi:DHH family phosphoesterase, partial [Micrococcus sp. SIMBA_144]
VQTVSNEASTVILVDHNERQQSAEDIERVRILEVIDHHRIANFETADPVYYRAEPVGCTATILNKLYKENNIQIDKNIAGLMLSA